MFVKLQNHNVHLFEHNSLESSKDTILIIPGAGMDHRLGQMIDLESFCSTKSPTKMITHSNDTSILECFIQNL